MRVKIKVISVLFLVVIYVVSCSDQQKSNSEDENSDTNTSITNSTDDGSSSESTSEYDTYFTDQLVTKVCDCKSSSVDGAGSMNVQEMRECMGGTMIDIVKEKLGEEATEIQIEEARKVFVGKINKKCS